MDVEELNAKRVAWRKGYKSVVDNGGSLPNPYLTGTREWQDWQDGYEAALKEG